MRRCVCSAPKDLSICCVWAPVVGFLFPDIIGCDAIEAFDVAYKIVFPKLLKIVFG